MEVVTRFFHGRLPARQSFFLFGPRGTGKSTLVRQAFPDAVWVDLLDPAAYRQFKAYPERLRELVLAHGDSKTFVIDEVQRVSELLTVVHQLMAMKRDWQFVLTGSSARKLKRSGVDLLAGRALLKNLHPFMAAEIPGQFTLAQNLKIGMLPLVVDAAEPLEHLKAYLALYMREEVQWEGLVRKVEQFAQFLEVISLSQALPINFSALARDCHISSKTVESYVQILEDLLLSFRLPVFKKAAKRHLSSHAKFYFFDVGVFQTIRPMGPLDLPGLIAGQALETLIAQHLRAWLAYSSEEGKLFFWRTKSGLEVDFVVYGAIGFYAFEVKAAASVRSADLRALSEFRHDYPDACAILLYGGQEKMLVEDIWCMPIETFLKELRPNCKPLADLCS